MNIIQWLFYTFGGLSLMAALLILFTKNIIHAAYLLVVVFLGIAGIYILARAEFIAVTQVIIYAGGILILLLFGIMLTNRMAGQRVLSGTGNLLAGMAVGITLIIVFISSIGKVDWANITWMKESGDINKTGGIKQLGALLLTDYLLAFEVAGVLLLIVLIGSAFMAGRDFGKEEHGTD